MARKRANGSGWKRQRFKGGKDLRRFEVLFPPDAQWVPLLGDRLVPDRFNVRVGYVETPDDRERRGHWRAELEAVIEDGRAKCIGIKRGGGTEGLTGAFLRDLAVDTILRAALGALARERATLPREKIDPLGELDLEADEEGNVRVWAPVYWRGREAVEALKAEYAEAAQVPRRQGRRLTDEYLRTVVDIYRKAERAPTSTVAEVLSVPRSTAGRLVVEARRRGLLGKAIPRRAGEAREEDNLK